MSDYGIIATFPGFNAENIGQMTAGSSPLPDYSEILFSSGFFVYKVIASGTVTQAIASTSPTSASLTTINVAHGLSYVPLTYLYFSVDGGTTWFANTCDTEGSSTGQPFRSAQVGADSTNVRIDVVSSHLGAYTFTGRYLIFADTGS